MAAPARRWDSAAKASCSSRLNVPLHGQVFGGDAHMTDPKGIGQGRHHHVDHRGIAMRAPLRMAGAR